MRSARSKTILISFLCAGVLVFLYLFTVLPLHMQIQDVAEETADLRARITIQENYAQVYPRLLTQSNKYDAWDFPGLEKKPLDENDIGKVVPELHRIIEKSKLGAVSVQPMSESIADNGSSLRVDMVLQGSWDGLREFWTSLVKLPYWKRLQSLEARAISGDREYRLTVWFSLT